MTLGIIAEEDNDIEVLVEITKKLVDPRSFSIKKFVGHGCGKLRKKCKSWARNLSERGCDFLVVVHDLDRAELVKLKKDLDAAIAEVMFVEKLVLIPVEELEAWLLFDSIALKECFEMKSEPKTPKNPEKVESPKEFLRDLIWKTSKKRYINTLHNKRIASRLDLEKLSRCSSYLEWPNAISNYRQKICPSR